jgi:hypothetical protein
MFRPWPLAKFWELANLLACAVYVSSHMVGILHVIKIIITNNKCKILNISIVVKIKYKIIVTCCWCYCCIQASTLQFLFKLMKLWNQTFYVLFPRYELIRYIIIIIIIIINITPQALLKI